MPKKLIESSRSVSKKMTNQEILKKVKQFKKTFGFVDCTTDNLRATIEAQGYTVVEFNHIINDEAVQTLIDSLKLSDSILRTKGFTYADPNYRLVFVHEDLSDQEKMVVLAHENGHIFLGHLISVPIIGKDVNEEYEANEFAHYLLNKTVANKLGAMISRHKKKLLCLVIALLLLVSGFFIFQWKNREVKYYGEYYITTTGNKYHEKECIFVKNKTNVSRLTKQQFDNGDYEPCQTCLP